jgi:threonylcarbamoyladenosine tRNA methylthiotransferase MtaB
MTARRVGAAFRTLGCKVNQVESERIAGELISAAFELVPEEAAEVVVVNTCSVTGEADRKARKEVRQALGLPRSPLVVVTGCLAALDAPTLRALSERVVVEADKSLVAARVAEALGLAPAASPSQATALRAAGFHTRAMVKVEDGCDAYCAYCIVPYARGLPRSTPLRDVVAEVEALVEAGTAEVVLTGINIGRYRDGTADLAELVREVAATGVPRVRLSSIEPLDLSGRLLETLADTPSACRHLHVPLQAGCDTTLRAMDRAYDTKAYAAILAEARSVLPDVALSTDVIAGFPGESVADAMTTLSFVEECGFMRLHVFRYSPRPGTLAAEMPGQVDPRDKRIRSERLRDAGRRLADEYARGRSGSEAEVLVERVSEGMAEGTSEDYLKVTFDAGGARVGELVRLTLDVTESGDVTGRW